jgi:erythritol kinase
MTSTQKIIIGIDAGTSVIKAVAFDLSGRQIATASVRNRYATGDDGSATQSLARHGSIAPARCAVSAKSYPILRRARRPLPSPDRATARGSSAAPIRPLPMPGCGSMRAPRPRSRRSQAETQNRARFEATGTGLNTCQQGAQLAHMDRFTPDLLDRAETALHCKDWLYLNLTGVRATDPSEASFTFGNFRTRQYDAVVIDALGLDHRRALLPEIIDGTEISHALTAEAAKACGLLAGTPVMPRLCRHGDDRAWRRRAQRRAAMPPARRSAPPACTCAPRRSPTSNSIARERAM